MLHQVQDSDFILCVCTAVYSERFENRTPSEMGKGARFEAHVITTKIYEDASVNVKFVPIIFNAESVVHIPTILKSATFFCLEQQYDELCALLTRQALYKKEPLGPIRAVVPHDPA
ncbi:MAG: SEFIR domain-containing protein [Bryobacteraceae bacterium]